MNTSQNEHDSEQFDELADRLADRALREHFGDEAPPDLAQRIMAAAAATPAAHEPALGAKSLHAPPSRRELALAASVLVLLAGGLCALFIPGLRGPATTSNQVALNKIDQRLLERTTFEFRQTPLVDVADYLRDEHRIAVVLDEKALDDLGLSGETLVTAQRHDSPFGTALSQMLLKINPQLTYVVQDDTLLITSKTAAQQHLTTIVFPVFDLVLVDATKSRSVKDSPNLLRATLREQRLLVGGVTPPGNSPGVTYDLSPSLCYTVCKPQYETRGLAYGQHRRPDLIGIEPNGASLGDLRFTSRTQNLEDGAPPTDSGTFCSTFSDVLANFRVTKADDRAVVLSGSWLEPQSESQAFGKSTPGSELVLNFNATAPHTTASWDINGNGVVGADGTLDLSSRSETINRLSGTGTVVGSSASGRSLSVGVNSGSATFTGTIVNGTSTLALTKIGSGTQTLSGSNTTYSGVTTVNGGGTLSLTSAGTLSKAGAGTLTLTGASTYSGVTTVNAGTLVLGGGTLAYTGRSASTNRAFTLKAGDKGFDWTNGDDAVFSAGTDAAGAYTATIHGPLARVEAEQTKPNSLRTENEMLRTSIRDSLAMTDAYFNSVVIQTEKNHAVLGRVNLEKERNQQLLEEVANMKEVFGNLPKDPKLLTKIDAIELDGAVVGVKKHGEATYVQLTLGSDDGVRVGHSLGVYRDGRCIANVAVVRADPDKAIARVVQQSTDIERRDRVMMNGGQSEKGLGAGEGGDRYRRIVENMFLASLTNPLSTFSIDVDTASYSNLRQFLMGQGTLPPPDAVRIEEMLNYFHYGYEGPKDDRPFAVHVEVAACPWQSEHRLVRIALKGREIKADKRPRANLVFLIDVSGSMDEPNKLPLLVRGLKLLTEQLRDDDQVSIVVYAGSEGLVLSPTPGAQRNLILSSLDKLQAGGSTNGGAGINLAYKIAGDNFIRGGLNRVILCTDGDFNVGTTSDADLERLIEEKAKEGTFLTVLGFGRGNFNDTMLETISGKGNGNYAYVDNINEARKVLVEQLTGTIMTIAKDVKIQVEFNPAKVAGFRLLGYEDRILAAEDFNNDKKDAGEIGAGHTVTALYEIVPVGKPVENASVDALKYQTPQKVSDAAKSNELMTVKLRYKEPDGEKSKLMEHPVPDDVRKFAAATSDFQFAAAVAEFGMLLRNSKYKGAATYDAVLEIATQNKGDDVQGYRNEFLELVRRAKGIEK